MKKILSLIIRYSLLIVAGLNLDLFYKILLTPTLYLSSFMFSFFFNTSILSNLISISNLLDIEIIAPCVAGAAYYLLLILNLSTPSMKIRKRIWVLLVSFVVLLLLNSARIFYLGIIFLKFPISFEAAHQIFWYLLSTIFVVGIWFVCVKIFKINKIPFYSDFKFVHSLR